MQDLLQHLPAVLYEFTIQPDGKEGFNYISAACESILGVKAEDVLKDASILESNFHEDDIESFHEQSRESILAGTELNWQGRLYVNKTIKWVEIRSNHEIKDDRTVVRRGIIQDVT